MASYTEADLSNAYLYACERLKLAQINLMYGRLPNLASSLTYTITQADKTNDYYYPSSFAEKAIKVNVTLNENACRKFSCSNLKFDGTYCLTKEEPTYYRVGDNNNFDLQCQPSCYNLQPSNIQYNSDDVPTGQSVLLNWYKGSCLVRPTTTTTALEKPVWRDKTRYTLRVNDFASGMERFDTDDNVTGITYKTNKTFCSWFGYDYDEPTSTCLLDAKYRYASDLFGSYLVRLILIYIIDGNSIFNQRQFVDGLPEPPAVDEKYYLSAWQKDIEADFVLPSVDATVTSATAKRKRRDEASVEGIKKRLKRETEEFETQKAELESIKQKRMAAVQGKSRAVRPVVGDAASDALFHILEQSASNLEDLIKRMCKGILNFFVDFPTTGISDLTSFGKFLGKLIKGFLTGLFTVDGVMGLSPALFKSMGKLITFLTSKLVNKITEFVTETLADELFENLLGKAITATATIIAKTLAEAALTSLKLLSALLEIFDGIGELQLFTMVIEYFLEKYDVGKLANYKDNIYWTQLINADIYQLRQTLDSNNIEMTFDLMCNLTFTTVEQVELAAESILYTYEYLDSLVVNSEGSRIDKGNKIDFSNDC